MEKASEVQLLLARYLQRLYQSRIRLLAPVVQHMYLFAVSLPIRKKLSYQTEYENVNIFTVILLRENA